MTDSSPAVSILIATHNRGPFLEGLLRALEASRSTAGVPSEVLIIDNGSTDRTAAVLEGWAATGPKRRRLFVAHPGKSRALNHALQFARAPLLAFTDDDVELEHDWLKELIAFFSKYPHYDAATGRVLVPPSVTDAEVCRRIDYFRTIPLFDGGSVVGDSHHLYGCNMGVRRRVFDAVGGFNERLGPGASGLHDDGDLAERILRAGMRIGYMPATVVYHTVEPTRLTPEYFRLLHLRDARSRFEMKPDQPRSRSVAHLLGAAAVFTLWLLLGQPARRMRARGRMLFYSEFLRLQFRRVTTYHRCSTM